MLKDKISGLLDKAVAKVGIREKVELQQPVNLGHGDYSTNIALKCSKQLNKTPLKLAENIVKNIDQNEMLEKTEVVKPGFINFWLSPKYLLKQLPQIQQATDNYGRSSALKNKKIMLEFTDPNPFKEFHIGHLYSNIVGESLSRLFESQGANLRRVNYQGDIGLHVAKAIWGIQQQMQQANVTLQQLKQKKLEEKVAFMGQAYALGTTAYETNKQAKAEITQLNKQIYDLGPAIKDLYEQARQWSLDYFETIYVRLGTKFAAYYFEREVGEKGLELVKQYLNKNIFKQSKGAIIFEGEKYGLHTRVFINSQGLPTYETKDLGLAFIKYNDFPSDLSFILTGNEIQEYFKVVLKVLDLINPKLSEKTQHLTHGMVRLPEGKMSSRTGNVVTGVWLLNQVYKKALEKIQQPTKTEAGSTAEKVGTGAVKYALLKHSLGKDIEFRFEESVNLEGNSGPYLQYTYVRCQSVLGKTSLSTMQQWNNQALEPEELIILRLLIKFPETVAEASNKYSPSLICNYLFELAQVFNLFYQKHQILKAKEISKNFRLMLTLAVGQVIKNGLYLLGIQTVDKM